MMVISRRAVALSGTALAGVALSGTTWLAASSWLFAWSGGLLGEFPHPWTLWATYALAQHSSRASSYLAITGLVCASPWLIACKVMVRRRRKGLRPRWFGGVRPVKPGVTDNHGHSRWATPAEIRERFPGPVPSYGGVVVGEAYRVDQTAPTRRFDPLNRRTWGNGGRAPLIIDPCLEGPTHSLIFAASGAYKTTCAVTTMTHWTGSSVMLDPKCKVAGLLRGPLDAQGKVVRVLDPGRGDGFNVLDWIDTKDPLAEMHVHTVVSWIVGESSGKDSDQQQFFRKMGKDLIACLLADLIWDDDQSTPKTLATLRVAVKTPGQRMRTLLQHIHDTSASTMARHLAGSLMDIVEETFSGVHANANQGTSWLSIPALAAMVSGDSFKSDDLVREPTSVFIQIPLDVLMNASGAARVTIGALMNAVYRAKGRICRDRVLFLIDEAAQLGAMKQILTARDTGREAGITMQLLYQGRSQLDDQWGRERAKAWLEGGVSWHAYAALGDPYTAEELSKTCGKRGVMATSFGENSQLQGATARAGRSRGRATNTHEISAPVIPAAELTQDVRPDELFLITRGCPPIRCGRAIWFRRPEIVAQLSGHSEDRVRAA